MSFDRPLSHPRTPVPQHSSTSAPTTFEICVFYLRFYQRYPRETGSTLAASSSLNPLNLLNLFHRSNPFDPFDLRSIKSSVSEKSIDKNMAFDFVS